jgi:hypothetical protein
MTTAPEWRAIRLRLKQLPGDAGGRLGDFADAGEHDAVGHVAFACNRFVIGFHAEAVRQGHHHSERARRRADFTSEPVGQFHSLPQSGRARPGASFKMRFGLNEVFLPIMLSAI